MRIGKNVIQADPKTQKSKCSWAKSNNIIDKEKKYIFKKTQLNQDFK